MRVRITKALSGVYDRVALSRLTPRVVYELGSDLAMWLIAQGVAEEDVGSGAAVPPVERRAPHPAELGGVVVVPADDSVE